MRTASSHQPKRYNMGLAVVHPDDTITTIQSDQPYTHIREARDMSDLVNDYLASTEYQHFLEYAGNHVPIVGIGSGDLGQHTVAAVVHNGLEALLLSNYDGRSFQNRVQEMAEKYHLNEAAMTKYVLTHEMAHLAGNESEAETERFVKHYFQSRAFQTEGEERKEYLQLAKIAEQREYEAEQ